MKNTTEKFKEVKIGDQTWMAENLTIGSSSKALGLHSLNFAKAMNSLKKLSQGVRKSVRITATTAAKK